LPKACWSDVRIEVRLFAMQRAQAGRRSHGLELPAGADVAAAWAALVADFPALAPGGGSVRFAVNGRYVEPDAPLAAGDELAVIPPVAGGATDAGGTAGTSDEAGGSVGASGAGHPAYRRIEITGASLDEGLLEDLRRAVATPADGAVAIFLGQTRESAGTPAPGQEAEARRHAGELVEGLSYEAFEAMAMAVLGDIADEIAARFGVHRVAIVHRIGDVAVGEASVLIVVASPHRDEAFAACRYAIEELKARAPIWKAERFADGSVWMGAPPRPGARPSPGVPPPPGAAGGRPTDPA
jgi:molybdopterin synthase catalytic subunit